MTALESFDPILADLRGVADRLRADLAANATPISQPSFERAMSALTYAVGQMQACPPSTVAEHNRLTDQISRLETVENRSRRAIQNAANDDGDFDPTNPPAARSAVPQLMEIAA